MFEVSELELLLLQVLDSGGSSHPYQIGKDIEARAGRRVVSLGAVYRALHRLEGKGLVSSAWEDIDPSASGRPRRRVYALSLRGGTVLSAEQRTRSALQLPLTKGFAQ